MGNNLKQIQQLLELQRVDDQIHEVKEGLEGAPKKLEELEGKFADVDARREHILDKLSHLEDQKKRLSLEIDEDAARIKKSKSKLSQVGNEREYQAMMREVDSIEKMNRTREEERSTLLEELTNQKDLLAEINTEYDAVKNEMDERRSSLQATVDAANAELARLDEIRSHVGAEIELSKFQRYEFIRKRLEHPVIVTVEDGICSGCHIAIPPQDFIDLQTGQTIPNCPNCQRLIYWGGHFDDPSENARRKAETKRNLSISLSEEDEAEDERDGMAAEEDSMEIEEAHDMMNDMSAIVDEDEDADDGFKGKDMPVVDDEIGDMDDDKL